MPEQTYNVPYKDEHSGDHFVRIFNENIKEEELVWHRDKQDREVEVIFSSGWKFQFDNEMPFELKLNDKLFVPKDYYHRLIKGKSNLILKIKELI